MKKETREAIMEILKEEWNYGYENGYKRCLIDKICYKLRKGKNAETIAEELDEDFERINAICNIAAEYAPEFNDREVFNDAWNV